jgi:hypothetical protein
MKKGGRPSFNLALAAANASQGSSVWQNYTARNQTFREGLRQLQDSLDEPSIREECVKEVKGQEEAVRKQLKKE